MAYRRADGNVPVNNAANAFLAFLTFFKEIEEREAEQRRLSG